MTISPQEGKQSEFVHCEADVAFYGGSAGAGKSFALILMPLMFLDDKNFNAAIFRRTYPEVFNPGGIWDEAEKLYPICGAKSNKSDNTWRFKSGMQVTFAHMQHEKDKYNYQGAQIAFIGFDELTHFTKTQFFYMLSRNRKSDGSTMPFMRATTNPDADSWVAGFIEWWIDSDGFAIPERSGVVRWFVVQNDKEVWADSKAKLLAMFPGREDIFPLSFTFISASIDDNQVFKKREGATYLAKLSGLDEVSKQRLMHGNWKIRAHGLRVFKLPNYAEWPDIDSVGWLDPAYSGDNHTALCFATRKDGRLKLTGYSWPGHVGDLYATIINLCKKHRCGTLGVESNADKGASARDLNRMRGGNVVPLHEAINKHVRIIRFVHTNWDLIDFANDCQPEFMTHLLNYAEGVEPDDEADSAAGAIRLLLTPRRSGPSVGYAVFE